MFANKKWILGVLFFFFHAVLCETNQLKLDQEVVDYINGIIAEKIETLKKEGKEWPECTIIPQLMRAECESNFASVEKWGKKRCYLGVSRLFVDLLKNLVLNDTDNTPIGYCYTSLTSDYKIEATCSKNRLEKMLRATIEHELGHIFYKDHGRFYLPLLIAQFYCGLFLGGYAAYKWWSLEDQDPYFVLKKVAAVTTLGRLSYNYCTSFCYKIFNSTHVPAYKYAEQQADDFVTSNIDLLNGAIFFHEVTARVYDYIACNTTSISICAWFKGMSPVEYAKKNRAFVHRFLVEPWGLCETLHPLPQDRINRFKTRIEELKTQGHTDDILDPATITVYKGDEIVEQVIV